MEFVCDIAVGQGDTTMRGEGAGLRHVSIYVTLEWNARETRWSDISLYCMGFSIRPFEFKVLYTTLDPFGLQFCSVVKCLELEPHLGFRTVQP